MIFPEWDLVSDILLNTVRKDTAKSFERPSSRSIAHAARRSSTLESAKALFEGMFFDARKYDFSRVSRFKFNIKLDLDSPVTQKTMSAEDFFVVINYLLRLRKDVGASTTSTTSATAASARSSASSSRTSSVSAGHERAIKKRCRCTRTSTRRCRTT